MNSSSALCLPITERFKMYSAKIIIIVANAWLIPVSSATTFKTANDCYASMHTVLQNLSDELLENIGVQNMECVFYPMPKINPRRNT